MDIKLFLNQIYARLLNEYGEQRWWPADTPFEVMVGAILTQNTAWANVEKAIETLMAVCDMTPRGILSLSEEQLQKAVRPSGYFNQKAKRLKVLCSFIVKYGGDVERMRSIPTRELRQHFLDLHGIGPETADSILLYALERPVFVVDAYTARLCSRLGLTDGKGKYEQVQSIFMDNLGHDAAMFNEYHALIVRHCKEKCRKTHPQCKECPLVSYCTLA